MMKINNLTFSYENKKIFDNFSLEIPESGVTALTGPSGCGKTTLLRLIAGLENPGGSSDEKGEYRPVLVREDGSMILPERTAFLFQEDRLIPGIGAARQLTVAVPGCDAARCLEAVGLEKDADTPPEKMSGGMKRRLALARCLAYAQDKELVLLDEPFTGIDADRIASIAKMIKDLKIPVIITGHTEETLAVADRVLSIVRENTGRVI